MPESEMGTRARKTKDKGWLEADEGVEWSIVGKGDDKGQIQVQNLNPSLEKEPQRECVWRITYGTDDQRGISQVSLSTPTLSCVSSTCLTLCCVLPCVLED